MELRNTFNVCRLQLSQIRKEELKLEFIKTSVFIQEIWNQV